MIDVQQIATAMKALWPTIAAQLGGRKPEIQAAILADLVAIWLAGHFAPGNQEKTDEMREELLQLHIEAVRNLIPVNEAMIVHRMADPQ